MPPHAAPRSASMGGGFRFHNIDHPKQLKDKIEVQKNRSHVMRDYIAKESLKPMSHDARVNGLTHTRKRKRPDLENVGVSDNPAAPAHIFNSSPLMTAAVPHSHPMDVQIGAKASRSGVTTPESPESRKQSSASSVNGLSRRRDSFWSIDSRSASPYARISPYARVGSELNPFGTWPKFSDPSLDVTQLKWQCSRRFGSRALGQFWIPTLLRARHAFLSTIAISTAHDDLMNRAMKPSSIRIAGESVEHLQVRQEVVVMINESLRDPELKIADATIIAVLQLLNAEIMGCDDHAIRVHQAGLLHMVHQRGGLGKLGVHGQLASILSITNYMIAVLRETAPHVEYLRFALRSIVEAPPDGQEIPESPLYHRSCGYLSINKTLAPGSGALRLLEQTRELTESFIAVHRGPVVKPWWTSEMAAGSVPKPVSSLTTNIFAFKPANECSFRELSDRFTYEAIRLASRIYAQALARGISISKAASQLSVSAPPPPQQTNGQTSPHLIPMHIRIKEALMRTNLSDCWGRLSGVLFWITLIAGAAANPQSSAVAGGDIVRRETGDDEEARKWLAAVAVRCSIVLSFEHGGVMLETLKKMVAIEDVLARGEAGATLANELFVEMATVAGGVEGAFGPREPLPYGSNEPLPYDSREPGGAQRGFMDFAQEIWET